VNGQDGDGGDGGNHGHEHDHDEPCGSVRSLGRGLGDPHGVDESVRNEQDKLHGSSFFDDGFGEIVAGIGDYGFSAMGESEGSGVHLIA
jgi:hypothetical protein